MFSNLFKSNNALGIMSAIGASACFSTTDVTIKFLSNAYALHQIVLLRSLIGIALISSYYWQALAA